MEMSARLARFRCHRGTVSRDRLPILNPLTANAIGPLDQFRAGGFPVLDYEDDIYIVQSCVALSESMLRRGFRAGDEGNSGFLPKGSCCLP